MAGIMVMDELAELQKRVRGMESEIVTLRKTRDDALTKADKNDAALTGALSGLAVRMEALATRLHAAQGGVAVASLFQRALTQLSSPSPPAASPAQAIRAPLRRARCVRLPTLTPSC